jgi:hypothetical protein
VVVVVDDFSLPFLSVTTVFVAVIPEVLFFDPSLKNDAQRKTAKQEKLNLDLNFVDLSQKIANLDKLVAEKEIEIKKVQVEIDFLKRLYEIDLIDFKG